MFMMMLLS